MVLHTPGKLSFHSHRMLKLSDASAYGWFYLSTILNDYSRYIISFKLCTNMGTEDVTDTLINYTSSGPKNPADGLF